ncbi:MAG: hypothetical protein JXX14_21220 [Deltaproteobacteria bacterium]|nr:hypothetical protein [Deltaproteobacteria bacterium]
MSYSLKKTGTVTLFAYLVLFFAGTVVVAADDTGSNLEFNSDNISESDMMANVENQLNKSRYIEATLQTMIDSARKEKDTVRVLCIDDKLAQIQALLKGAQNRVMALKSTLNANDSGAARHQFVILQVSFNKLEGLRVQADACVGNSDFVVGPSESEVSVSDEYISTEDATTPDQEVFTPDPLVRPPTVASGFR